MEQSPGRSATSNFDNCARFRRLLKGHVWLRLRRLVTLLFLGAVYKYTYLLTYLLTLTYILHSTVSTCVDDISAWMKSNRLVPLLLLLLSTAQF